MITSKDNKTIKLVDKIKQKKYSRELSLCFVESIKIVKQLYNQDLVDTIILSEDRQNLLKTFNDCKIEVVSNNIAKYLSDSVSCDGVMAIAKIPTKNIADYSKCLILDNIQDPSNLGAIIRSARAFGYNTILAINSVYPYTFKCIRSSMGYIFDINYMDISLENLTKLKEENNLAIISADMNGVSIDDFKRPNGNYAIVIGNEGNGVSDEMMKLSDNIVSIPMLNNVESLNASVSASILMFNLK